MKKFSYHIAQTNLSNMPTPGATLGFNKTLILDKL
jgi:hypothetical protein